MNLEIVGDYSPWRPNWVHKVAHASSQDKGGRQKREEDPREELVRRLLEYEKYRGAAAELGGMEFSERTFSWRVTTAGKCSENGRRDGFVKFDLWSLVDTFSRICEDREKAETREISLAPQTYTVDERKTR